MAEGLPDMAFALLNSSCTELQQSLPSLQLDRLLDTDRHLIPRSLLDTSGALLPQFSGRTLEQMHQDVISKASPLEREAKGGLSGHQGIQAFATIQSSHGAAQVPQLPAGAPWVPAAPPVPPPPAHASAAGGALPGACIHRSVVINPPPSASNHQAALFGGLQVPPGLLPMGGGGLAAALPGALLFGMRSVPVAPAVAPAAVRPEAQRQAAAAARAARTRKRREAARQQQQQQHDATERRRSAAAAAPAALLQPIEEEEEVSGQEGKPPISQKRAIKNRESAARSRNKRLEYTTSLEAQVDQLRSQNRALRTQVIAAAEAPPDPHAGRLDGRVLRRTRTMPL